jgi:hypothetical protein
MPLAIAIISQPFMVTAAILLAAVGSFAGLAIRDRRPRESLNPSLIPTIPLMLLAGLVAMVALVVLLNLPRV